MIIYPNAKINLGLDILRRRKDGYHDISSVFYPVRELFDILEIIPDRTFSFSVSGNSINVKKNICEQAFNLIEKEFGIKPVKIHLHKQIPIGAGLGGGSADGAFTLIALNQLYNLQLSDSELKKYALELGADCPFFIDNKPQYVYGMGDKMNPIDLDLTLFEIKFIFPKLHISTVEAYAHVNPRIPAKSLLKIIELPIEKWREELKNDFELSQFTMHPILKSMKQKLYSDGAIYASMTGSGSVIYGLFRK